MSVLRTGKFAEASTYSCFSAEGAFRLVIRFWVENGGSVDFGGWPLEISVRPGVE